MTYSLSEIVQSDRLPSLPQLALRVIELAQEPEPDFQEVIRTVRTDPALSGKILRTANSALFGLGRPTESIEAAIPLLGMTVVRTIVLGFTLSDQRPGHRDAQDVLQKLWRSSLTQAVFAEQLASEVSGADPSTWFLAGLLQDIGILAALHVDAENYLAQVWDNSEFPSVMASERQYYGFTHVDIARELGSNWGLPDTIQSAIAMHHQHMQSTASESTPPLATALQAASLCSEYVVNYRNGGRAFEQFSDFLLQHYNWQPDQVEDMLRDTMLRVEETAAMYSFELGNSYSPERVLNDAKRLLEEIALASQAKLIATARTEQVDSAKDEALQDPMTGTYNRRFMDRVLNDKLGDNIRRRKPLGLLFLDIDRFKSINDTHGHQSGDEAICSVARIVKSVVRKSDFVIRYGGDEFLVALLNVSDKFLESIAERIRSEIYTAEIAELSVRMTTSVGALHYQPAKGDSLDTNWLIDHVDKAMYEAKRNGGDQVQLYRVSGGERPRFQTSTQPAV